MLPPGLISDQPAPQGGVAASGAAQRRPPLPGPQLWLHGHLHCRHDYRIGATRIVSNARGHVRKGEADGFDGQRVIDVFSAPPPA